MKQLLYTLALVLVSLNIAIGQNSKEDKKAAREVRKEAEAKMEQHEFEIAKQAIEDHDFVIEADQLIFKRGEMANVSAITNFISLDGKKAVIQIAVSNFMSGPNGLGGITVEGHISNESETTSQKGIYQYKFSILGVGVSASVEIQLRGDGNNATVTIYPNLNSEKLTMRGKVVPTDQSIVFKGRTL